MHLSRQEPRPFPIAHGSGNELGLLRRAEALGLPVVEADVHLYRRNLEVRHLKTLGPFPVLWDRWRLADPFAPRLTLSELLAAAAPHTELLLDLKGSDVRLSERVVAALAEHRRAATTVSSRAWRLLDPFRGMEGVRRLGSVGRPHQLRTVARRLERAALDGLSIQRRLLSPEVVARLLGLTSTIVTWPVRTAAQARELGTWGVAGVITDDLELAQELRRDACVNG